MYEVQVFITDEGVLQKFRIALLFQTIEEVVLQSMAWTEPHH